MAFVQQKQIDLAVLDIQLDDDKVYDVPDAPVEQEIPFVFVTGCERGDIPSRYAAVSMCQKPADVDAMIEISGRPAARA